MNEIALFLFFLILYTYGGYFFLTMVLGLFAGKRVRKKDIRPSVSLMIAAYNEEKSIAKKIENSLELDYPKDLLEIIVVSDGSSDKTDEIVNNYRAHGVKLIRVEGRVGKTEARNIAMKAARSEIILFSDATTEYRPDVVKKLARNFADPDVGMATGHLKYKSKGGQMGPGQKLFWKYETHLKKCQTQLGTLTGSVGCISAFRKNLYTRLPPNIIEDFTEPLMFILKGYRVVFEEEAVCYEYATEKSSQEWNMRVRVIRGGLAGLWHARRLLNPLKYPLTSFQLVSHKLLRWFVPVIAIFLFFTTVVAVGLELDARESEYLLYAQTIFYALVGYALYAERKGASAKVLALPYYLFIVNAASLAAIYKSLTLPLESGWEPDRGA